MRPSSAPPKRWSRSPAAIPGRIPEGAAIACRPASNRRYAHRGWSHEIALISPRVLIPIGGLAIGRFLGTDTTMTDLIGERFERDGRIIVPLPHPSGASQWFNAPENKGRLIRALEVLAALRRMTWARDLQNLTPQTGQEPRRQDDDSGRPF